MPPGCMRSAHIVGVGIVDDAAAAAGCGAYAFITRFQHDCLGILYDSLLW